MSTKRRRKGGKSAAPVGGPTSSSPARPAAPPPGRQLDRRARIGLLIVALMLATVAVIGADFLFGTITGQGPKASPSPTQFGVIVPGNGGHWTNVSADQLAQMLREDDLTLINVKTPYSNEIDGTDLWIPYDQLEAKASELPSDKGAMIVVYCVSGHQSAIAAQTLLDLGYTNVWNLDGGMNAWSASGRGLVDKNRK